MSARGWSAFVAGVCALLLYLPWLSIQFDLNGIAEAASVEAGGKGLLAPNHLLFRPLGAAGFALLRAGGYGGRAIVPLQCFSALCGALAIGFAGLAYRHLGADAAAAGMAAALLATSWAHWVFSTDASYITLAALLAAAALAAAAPPIASLARAAAAGMLAALATLAWQANVFLLPALAMGVARGARAGARLPAVAVFLTSAAAGVLGGYLAAAVAAGAAGSVGELVRWSTSYGGQGDAPMAIWGVWSVARIIPATVHALGSIVSTWDGLGLRALGSGILRPDKLLPQFSLVALLLLLIASAVVVARRSRRSEHNFAIGWMLVAYALYLPFIVWWEPFTPKWFLVPNIVLGGALAVVWGGASRAARRLAWACVAIIASANFANAVWPRYTRENASMSRARCIAQHVRPADLFVVSDWEWLGYAQYFDDYAGSSLLLINRRGRDAKLDEIERRVEEARRRGGRSYMVDVRAYSDERAAWLLEQTELSVADFTRFAPQPAFDCGDLTILELQPRTAS